MKIHSLILQIHSKTTKTHSLSNSINETGCNPFTVVESVLLLLFINSELGAKKGVLHSKPPKSGTRELLSSRRTHPIPSNSETFIYVHKGVAGRVSQLKNYVASPRSHCRRVGDV